MDGYLDFEEYIRQRESAQYERAEDGADSLTKQKQHYAVF